MSTIGVIGVGAMGEALLAGWLAAGWRADDICVVDAVSSRAEQVGEKHGVRAVELAEVGGCDIIVIATKPQQLAEVTEALADVVTAETLVMSIAAGITIAAIAERLPEGTRIVRVMPNTPALVGQGMSGIAPGPGVSDEEAERALDLMRAVGSAVVLPEKQLDAVTAVSGSGPAYLFYLAEAMTEAGVHAGLPRDVSTQLVNQTLLGAAQLLRDSDDSATVLRERVTSPAGTTAAALAQLDDRGVRAAVLAAISAAQQRSVELSGS